MNHERSPPYLKACGKIGAAAVRDGTVASAHYLAEGTRDERDAAMPRTIIPWPAGVNAIAPLSPAVLADGVLYVSGTLAFGADGQITAVGDIRGQTRVILGDIQTLLTTVGGTLADVTMNQIFLKSWSDYSAFNEVYLEYFPVGFPARFCIVCDLVRPEALVEIASVAHIGQRPSASDSA